MSRESLISAAWRAFVNILYSQAAITLLRPSKKIVKAHRYLLLTVVMFCTGCVQLTHKELEFLNELEACGISKTERSIRHPLTAGALNVVAGAGNFYLAQGTGEDSQWLMGAGNFVFWLASPLWAVPQAITDANRINMRETVYYYRHDPHGRRSLSRIQERYRNDPNSTCGKVIKIEGFPSTH